MSPDVTDYQLEMLLLDELPPDEARTLRARLEHDQTLRARVDELMSSTEGLRAAFPADKYVPELERRLHVARTRTALGRARRLRGAGLAVALTGVVAGAVLMVSPSAPSGVRPALEETTPKGGEGSLLQVHRRVGRASERLQPGAEVAAGDVLQVSFVPVAAQHATVVSIDGAGSATLHWPLSGEQSTAVSARVLVPRAYQLDDAPDFERFILVTSERAIEVESVMGAARQLAGQSDARTGGLALDSGLQQTSVVVRKAVH